VGPEIERRPGHDHGVHRDPDAAQRSGSQLRTPALFRRVGRDDDQHVDIALWSGLSASYRAKDAHIARAVLSRNAQNGLLRATTLGNVTDSIGYDGFGQVTKLCNQILCGLNLLGVSEAMVFARRAPGARLL
jgi:hypothetical protein